MNSLQRLGFACFLGGIACVGIALLIMPQYWWFGLAAGIAAGFVTGFIAEDVKPFAAAIPSAFELLIGALVGISSDAWRDATKRYNQVVAWIVAPHPVIAIMLVANLIMLPFVLKFGFANEPWEWYTTGDWVFLPIGLGLVHVTLSGIILLFGAWFFIAADVGTLRPQPTGYRDHYAYLLVGVGVILRFVFWRMWKYMAIGIWRLVQMTHSVRRVACGVHGTLGGVIALYLLYRFGTTMPTLAQALATMFFGGSLGAFSGVVSWVVAEKRRGSRTTA